LLNIVAERANKATTMRFSSLDKGDLPLYRDGDVSFKILSENVLTILMSQVFKPFSPFYESINNKVDQLITSGIISHWIKEEKLEIKFDEIGPQVLTWDHLYLGFAACMICLAIGFVIFLCELCQPKVKSFLDKCTVFNLVKTFLDSTTRLSQFMTSFSSYMKFFDNRTIILNNKFCQLLRCSNNAL